jgi:anti-anti-sigma factor
LVLVAENHERAPHFHVVVDVTGRPPRVTVSGEVELLTCAPFRDALGEAASVARDVIVLDCKRLTFIGSTGIREIVRTLGKVDCIEVHHAPSIVRRAFETAGLGSNLRIVHD